MAITDGTLHIQRTAAYSQAMRLIGFAGWAIPQSDVTVLTVGTRESTLVCGGSKITISLADETSAQGPFTERLRNLAATTGNA